MIELDPTITFTGTTIAPTKAVRNIATPGPPTLSRPSIVNPSKGSVGAAIASLISAVLSIFRSKH
jgi:hypothetical protein